MTVRNTGFLALALCACVGTAASAQSLDPSGNDLPGPKGGGTEIRLPGGAPAWSTANPVLNRRAIPLAGGGVLLLWDEITGSGTQQYAAFSLDGTKVTGRVRENSTRIHLRYGSFDPLQGAPNVDAAYRAADASNLRVVQLVASAIPQFQDALLASGAEVLRYLPDNALIVRVPRQNVARVSNLPFVRWVGEFHAAYKLEDGVLASLRAGTIAPEAVRYSIEMFDRGAAAQNAVANEVHKLGGLVDIMNHDGYRMEATLTPAQLTAIARMDEVHFIDPWGGPGGTDMNIVRNLGGANFIENTLGFTGQGVRGEVFDTELLTTHTEFTTITPLIHSPGSSDPNIHGTSVFGINFSRGANATARGLLPDAEEGIFYRATDSTMFGGAHLSRLQIAQALVNPIGIYRAVYQTSSYGSSQNISYSTLSAEMDDVTFQTQLIHTQSQSNTGNRNSRPQAWAKNVFSVGAVNHFNTTTRTDDQWTSTAASCGSGGASSIGPAPDNRIKPDLCFFYDCTFSANGTGVNSYTEFGGTSGATPSVAGYVGLFMQMWHENVFPGYGGNSTVFFSRARMTTVKAALANTAFRYTWTAGGPNASINRNVQGWGMPSLQNLYSLRNKTFIVNGEDRISPLETTAYFVRVMPGEANFNVSMSYVDRMGTVSSAINTVNDLSLRVITPAGTTFWGNNGLVAGNASTSGGVSNIRDTVENVFIPNPAPGVYKIEVFADNLVQDTVTATPAIDADYSIWATGCIEAPEACNAFDLPPFSTTFAGNVRGYYFRAPTDFEICGLRVPNETGQTFQHVEVVRFNPGVLPPDNTTGTNAFTSLFRQVNAPSGSVLNTGIAVRRGDVIGVLGQCGTTNSYGATPHDTEILGLPVTLERLGMQAQLATTPAANLWTESGSASLARVEMMVRQSEAGCEPMAQPAFDSTFTAPDLTRGYWFTAPTNMTICGLRVPDEAGAGIQNVEVVRMNAEPPIFPTTTNSFVSLGRFSNVPGDNVIQVNIPVAQGDVIGILGATGTSTLNSSYATSNTFGTTIRGLSVTLKRFGTQTSINAGPASGVFTTDTGPVSRVEMYFRDQAGLVYIDGDSAATGLNLETQPLSKPQGLVTFVNGELAINSGSDPEIIAAGSQGNVLDGQGTPANCELRFNFHVDSVTFIYGGNTGGIEVEAVNAANVVVDSFTQADTGGGMPAGPVTLAGPGIMKLRWRETTSGGSATLDNIEINATNPCYANCDGSIIQPLLNVLDFNCFLNRFSSGDPRANCDGSTAEPVLNVLDFNCFLNRFSQGCP